MRNCIEDEGLAPRSRLAGVGFKPPKAALVKSQGSERLGKVTAEDRGRYDSERRAQANYSMRRRNSKDEVKTGLLCLVQDEFRGNLFTA